MDHSEIVTARLLLRPWKRSDLDAYAAWPPFRDSLLHIFNRAPTTPMERDLAWTMAALDAAQRGWSVVRDETVIGMLTLRKIDLTARSGELGMLLGAPFVGQGLGTEALEGWLRTAFSCWQWQAVRLKVAAWNSRAMRLYARLHFVPVARFWEWAGPPEEWAFLLAPPYQALHPYFRWSAQGIYALQHEQLLTATRWGANHPEPHGPQTPPYGTGTLVQ